MTTERELERLDFENTVLSLIQDNKRLSTELDDKDALLKHFMLRCHEQQQQLTSLTAQDTAVWDRATLLRPPLCSTPTNHSTWAEVVVGKRTTPDVTPPPVQLSNRFSVLSTDGLHMSDSPPAPEAEPSPSEVHAQVQRASAVGSTATSPTTTSGDSSSPQRRSPRPDPTHKQHERGPHAAVASSMSSSRRQLIKEAVIRRSGGCPRSNPARTSPLSAASGGSLRPNRVSSPPSNSTVVAGSLRQRMARSPTTASSQTAGTSATLPPRLPPGTAAAAAAAAASSTALGPGSAATASTLCPPSRPADSAPGTSTAPRPLFSPTALLIGDSIIRNCRFFNASTHCFPGATVRTILDKLPELLNSAPPSVDKLIIHVGTNDTTDRRSETTKLDFIRLFDFLANCRKTVFISGPIPTLNRGDGRFSRILSLDTWLKHTSSLYNFGFIDNFNLFWTRSAFYRQDGLHPSTLGNRFLTNNISYTVKTHPLFTHHPPATTHTHD